MKKIKEKYPYVCPRCNAQVICLVHYNKKKYCYSCFEKIYYGNKEVPPAPLPESTFRNTAM